MVDPHAVRSMFGDLRATPGERRRLAEALRLDYHGKTYCFCAHACQREFEDRPDEYAEHPSPTLFSGVIDEPIRILATAVQEGEGPIGH